MHREYPETVEAFQYDGDLKGADGKYYVPDWAVKAFEDGVMFYEDAGEQPELFITAEENKLHVWVGDYVIRGIGGVIYPLSPDVFELLFNPAE